jgi:tRNA modification GTPase
VADLIHSRTELALAAANEQLAGHLSKRIHQLRDDLMHTLAHVEAHIDFPDEDIAPATLDQLLDQLDRAVRLMDDLLRTAPEGQLLRRGIRAALVGRTNTGKSSLLNLLLGHDRAIVSSIHGTTRDTIEETANIRGIPVVLVDSAGLRDAGDEIEMEGIRRSHQAMQRADLILHVLDGSERLTAEDESHLEQFTGRKRILVRNKIDLAQRLDFPGKVEGPIVELSCKTGAGLDHLKDKIKEMVWAGEISSEMLQVMINSRHQEALRRAREGAVQAAQALQTGQTLELVAVDLHGAVKSVGEIVGKTSTEDLLDSIFSQFCIGK